MSKNEKRSLWYDDWGRLRDWAAALLLTSVIIAILSVVITVSWVLNAIGVYNSIPVINSVCHLNITQNWNNAFWTTMPNINTCEIAHGINANVIIEN